MSHYTVCKTKITRKSALITALKALGFKDHMIEQSEEPLKLRGYSGDTRKQQAHVRIKGSGWGSQNYVGGASNDLGFERLADGSWVAHISEFDSRSNGYGNDWVERLENQYAKATVYEVAQDEGLMVEDERVEANGEIVIRLTTPWA